MATSTTEIANLALTHIGVGREIQSLDAENSEEANACRRVYEETRKKVLREFGWPFATMEVTLAKVEDDPNNHWAFSYRYPPDALELRKIPGSKRTDSRQSRVPYRVSQDASGLLIWTDKRDACVEYTVDEKNVSRFPSDFVMAFSLKIAFYIVPRLAKGDRFQMRERIEAMYRVEISDAKASALNEEQPDEDPRSEYERSRHGDVSLTEDGQDPLAFLKITT